jgi:plasmid stabilization system protein ParE
MRIRWTPPAAADLQSISDYLKDHHPQYRQPTMRKLYLYQKIRALKDARRSGTAKPGSYSARVPSTKPEITPSRCLDHGRTGGRGLGRKGGG